MPADDTISKIIAFLEMVGITVIAEPVADSLLPGVTVRNGSLVYDPKLPYPGDLLHEAGHVAVTDPALRSALTEVPSDPAEEMAAIAWSYAAALAAKIDPALVFHEYGYRGGGGYLIDALAGGQGGPGVPMLQYYGMTGRATNADEPIYPAMSRWLR